MSQIAMKNTGITLTIDENSCDEDCDCKKEKEAIVKIDPEPADEVKSSKWTHKIHTLNLADYNEKIIPLKIEKSNQTLAGLQLLLSHKETGLIKNYFITRIQYVQNDKIFVDKSVYSFNFTELSCPEISNNTFTIIVKLNDDIINKDFLLSVNLVYENN